MVKDNGFKAIFIRPNPAGGRSRPDPHGGSKYPESVNSFFKLPLSEDAQR